MGYQEVFGGSNVYPADVTYLALALTGNIDLDWPMESAAPPYPLARIIDVMATLGPHTMRLPDATMSAPGSIVLFNNLSVSSPCFVADYDGNVVAGLGAGEQWEIYLTDNTTQAGQWQVFRFGASTATVQPSALAGYGLTVTGSTLSQSVPVQTINASPRNVLASDRASALVWTGAGTGLFNLPGVGAVGNNYFFSARNAGGGMLTLDPLGGEVVDGAASVSLTPGEGVVLVTDGVQWFTLGRGQSAVFAFDYTVIDLTGQPSPYVLSGVQLNRISYKFTGALTTNMIVQVPTTVQQYWVDNRTTGAFSLSLRAGAAGVPIAVVQGSRGIYYCDGTNIIDADTSSISVPISASDGGTGQSVYAIGDLLVASGATTLAKLAAAPVGQLLISQGAGTVPIWSPNVPIGGTLTVGGTTTITAGGQALALKAGAGLDHVFMSFFARDATPLVRTAYIGFNSPAATALTINNDIINGAINHQTLGIGAHNFLIQATLKMSLSDTAFTHNGTAANLNCIAGQSYTINFQQGGIAKAAIFWFNTDSKIYHDNSTVGAGHVFRTSGATERLSILTAGITASGFVNINSVDVLGSRGMVQISAAQDPAITPAALDVRQHGVGGSAAVPQYGIRFDGTNGSSNAATHMFGIWSHAKQNIGGAATAIYGETPQNSGAIGRGVHGKAAYTSNVVYGLAMLCGVYGECVTQTSVGNTSVTSAGAFEHKGTAGSYNVGVYASTVAGATNPRPLYCAHNGLNVFEVGPLGPMGSLVTTIYAQRYEGGDGAPNTGASGRGIEIIGGHSGGYSYISCYNRTLAANAALSVNASVVVLNGLGTTAAAANMVMDASNSVLKSTSSVRYKRDIKALAEETARDIIMALNPITYVSKIEGDGPQRWYGLIAEDVAKVEPRLVSYAFADDDYERSEDWDVSIPSVPKEGVVPTIPDSVQYERLIVPLIAYIQQLEARLAALEAKLP